MKKQYILSERAHFMCPNMNFGILMKIDGEYDEDKFLDTLEKLAEAHPFLRALVAYEDQSDKMFYDVSETSKIAYEFCEGAFSLADYEGLMKKRWNVLEEGLLKVYVYQSNDSFEVLLMAHHLLADGTGVLQLAEEIADAYVEGKKIARVEEQLITSLSDLPAGSELTGISKWLVNRANRQWKKENHKVSYEDYATFEKNYNLNHRLEYQCYNVDDDTYQDMKRKSKDNGVTINDLLMAEMYIKTGIKKIIIAADIRKKLQCYNAGAMGNYATAMGIECKSKTTDVLAKAKEVHKLVANALQSNKRLMLVLACYFAMEPTLIDAAAISGLGGFDSKAASFVGGGMFGFAKPASCSITNLGKIENKNIVSAMFIPPASPASKLTLGVVTVNEKMYACSSKCV